MKSLITFLLTLMMASAAAAQVETEPLYRYRSSQSNFLFTTSPTLPHGVSGQWKREAVVCHVPKPGPGIRPIFSLVKADELGARYAYTTDRNESAAGWQRQEAVAWHVSVT